MAEVLIAAAPGETERARAIAEALTIVGFDATAEAPVEAEVAHRVDAAKCVLTLWTGEAAASPLLAAQAALALERKKLVCAELERGAAPSLFETAPRIDLATRDRAAFRARFEALIAEIEKLTPTEADSDRLAEALLRARGALLRRPSQARVTQWATLGAFVMAVGLLFVLGFGAGRVINAVRSGDFAIAPSAADADARPISAPTPELAWEHLESEPWRAVAARIDAAASADIKARAEEGDARAQAIACLGHLAGAEGFLPSPSAALAHCDASAAQGDAAGLYLSWVLHRTAPHAGVDEATARQRLAEAARRGWLAALIEYGQVLAPDARAPLADQTEAGRLWLAAAERGDPRGQFFYARWLRDSPAGPRDPAAAIPYLERAADSGQVEAAHMLATLYRDGIGAPRDARRARTLYEQAAEENYPPAMFNLADMLRGGPAEEHARAVALYRRLACMPDERQIQPMAAARLRALRESAACR